MKNEIYIVGIFDCGCSYESSFGSVEVVRCSSQSEVLDIKQKMGIHSVGYQCHEREAVSITIFEGKIQWSDLGKEDSAKSREDSESGIYSYQNYIKLWNLRSKENAKFSREQKKWNKKFEEEVAKEEEKFKRATK